LTPLKNMKDLAMLNLRSNMIYDLEPLRSLTKIRNLYLDDNRIWNIEALQNHKFDTHYDTGALLYGLTLSDNYLDLRTSTKSYQLLQKLSGDGHLLNQLKAQRLVIGSTTAYVGDSSYKISIAPFLHSSRTYVPVRFVAERLGANVAWDQSNQEVTIHKGSTTIRWAVNEKQARVNEQTVSFDTPLLLKKSTTFVPVRFVSELLSSDVEYIPSTRSVLIFEGK
jgi:internalin A